MAIPISNVTSTDTFGSWLNRTNDIAFTISNFVVTTAANSTGSATQGNAFVEGIFSANTFAAVNGIRGGNVTSSATLNVLSNANFQGALTTVYSNLVIENTNTIITSSNLRISDGNVLITSNVNIKSNTIHISTSGRLGVNTGNPDATLTVFGTANVSGVAKFLSDVFIEEDATVLGTLSTPSITTNTINTLSLLVSEDFNISGNTTINQNLNVDKTLVVNNNLLVFGDTSVSGSISANSTTVNYLFANNPIPVSAGGTGLSSLGNGILAGNGNGSETIRVIDGAPLDVLIYSGSQWIANVLPSMAYQNSDSVNITGGSISGISSLSVTDNTTVTGNVSIESNLAVTGSVTCNSIVLGTTLPVQYGGTGRSSFTSGSLLIGDGSSAINELSPSALGTSGKFLKSDGTQWVPYDVNQDIDLPNDVAVAYNELLLVNNNVVPIGGYVLGTVTGGSWSPNTWQIHRQVTGGTINTGSGAITYGTWRHMGQDYYQAQAMLLQRVA
jgi:hypothetical protein